MKVSRSASGERGSTPGGVPGTQRCMGTLYPHGRSTVGLTVVGADTV